MTEKRRRQNREANARRKFTFTGVSNLIYNNQRKKSRRRGHNPPEYSLDELRVWLQQQPQLETLLKDYEDSGGDSELAPSVNRLDDNFSYSFDNIELITWKENREIEYEKKRKPIIQLSLDDEVIREWSSITEAAREIGIHQSGISAVCRGVCNTAGGYKFKFSL